LQASFTPKDSAYILKADAFRMGFDFLLAEVAAVSNGMINPLVLQSGELVTPYTLKAEMVSSFFTGIKLQTTITEVEAELKGGKISDILPMTEQVIYALNEKAMILIRDLLNFKRTVFSKVSSCKMFTTNYPHLVEHIIHEAEFYLKMVQKLQRKEDFDIDREAYEQETFWNDIMGEHAKTIRGLLDPTEEELFNIADSFGKEFDQLNYETRKSMQKAMNSGKLTADSLKATREFRDFKVKATQGILECKIKSIIIPLLSDHVLREANHYLRLLYTYELNK